MKILVPLNNIDNIKRFAEAGAEELYAGFYDQEWFARFGNLSEINRMSNFKKHANKYTLDELIEISRYAKDNNSSLYVTINAQIYSQEQMEMIRSYMKKISNSDIAGVIVSTPELTMVAKSFGIKSVCSTMCAIYNSDLVDFYKDIGADKIIFPRDLTLEEIRKMVKKNPDIEYEVFLMRNGCIFSDSHCLGYHADPYESLCGYLRNGTVNIHTSNNNFDFNQDCRSNALLYRKAFRKFACGQCAIYDFLEMGIASCKIVGRVDKPNSVLDDIILTKKNIEIAKASSSRDEYLKNMIFPSYMALSCNFGYACYYPDIRF